MLRLIYPILLAFTLNASILPDKIGEYQKTAPAEVELADKAVWTEYGLQESERAAYGPLRITAYRFGDSTGAEAGSQWLQGEKASGTMLLLRGNYVVVIEGPAPHRRHLEEFAQALPGSKGGPRPPLAASLPQRGLQKYSARYILGPQSLGKFEPRIPADAAGFDMGAEGQIGRYGDLTLAVFSYPTPHIARERLTAFERIPGAQARRTGTLVVAVVGPQNDAATALLNRVEYRATVTASEPIALPRRENVGEMLLSIFSLAGLLLVLCLLGGVAFAAIRLTSRRFSGGDLADREPMTRLHLDAPSKHNPV